MTNLASAITLDELDPAADRLEPSRVRPVGASDFLAVGDVVADKFVVRAKLGEGGMGQVWEAHDRTLGRRVAVKVAHPSKMAALHREARALAVLRHPGIVSVYGIGEHAGVPYVVMEHISGPTLQAHIESRRREGGFPIDEAIDILAAVADALAVVHQAGMAHRDVKPANVMLAPHGHVVLTDFGIFQPEIEVAAGLQCAGSPPYLAPEIFAMKVTPGQLYLVDVYALGVLAFELLTGVLPYDDENVMKILWLHGNAPVPDPAALRPGLPPRLADLVREMLEKDPRARAQDMEEISFRLRHARSRAPMPSRP
ncbi:MAG: serine/threonine-protein kinase [Polyangiaceae bacterium]|jgi:serine/threonine-protein kinase